MEKKDYDFVPLVEKVNDLIMEATAELSGQERVKEICGILVTIGLVAGGKMGAMKRGDDF